MPTLLRRAGAFRGSTLARQVLFILFAAMGGLLLDLRFEHREVLGETWHAWIPLFYTAAMLLCGGLALLRWDRGGRRVLRSGFALGMVVGIVGFWLHTGGHPLGRVQRVLAIWRVPAGQDGGFSVHRGNPILAPLAFVGLGLLGVLACAPDQRGS